MAKTLCYSVRLQSLTDISEKAYSAVSFDGSEDIIPKSCVFDIDLDVEKSDAYWIAAWILPKKKIQFSNKKSAWFDENRHRMDSFNISRHHPAKIEKISNHIVEQLKK